MPWQGRCLPWERCIEVWEIRMCNLEDAVLFFPVEAPEGTCFRLLPLPTR